MHYQAVSRPMHPAHFIAVDAEAKSICVVVRGTTTWHDAISDICGHHVPLDSGVRYCCRLCSQFAQAMLSLLLCSTHSPWASCSGWLLMCWGGTQQSAGS